MPSAAIPTILQAHETGAKVLDLGNLGLEGQLPHELLMLNRLLELRLGDETWDQEENRYVPSTNTIGPNLISALPTGLSQMENLLSITANGQPIPWDSHMGDFPTLLSHLDISSSATEDLLWLRKVPRLRVLCLGFCPIKSLSGIEFLQQLEVLRAYNTDITDLNALQRGLSHLMVASFSGSPIRSLGGIEGLSQLQELDLSFTEITEIRELRALQSLESLNLRYSPVSDIRPLQELHSLQRLDLGYCQVKDVAPLALLPKLNFLDISHTQVADISPLLEAGFVPLQQRQYTDGPEKQVLVAGDGAT